ncbi:MAG TPA: hypothetical protein VNC50_10455 [Planctomycetia bacterium]|nr:hypothetical protein [Planctomycetia bacterium]
MTDETTVGEPTGRGVRILIVIIAFTFGALFGMVAMGGGSNIHDERAARAAANSAWERDRQKLRDVHSVLATTQGKADRASHGAQAATLLALTAQKVETPQGKGLEMMLRATNAIDAAATAAELGSPPNPELAKTLRAASAVALAEAGKGLEK